jgi:hypothetical protein
MLHQCCNIGGQASNTTSKLAHVLTCFKGREGGADSRSCAQVASTVNCKPVPLQLSVLFVRVRVCARACVLLCLCVYVYVRALHSVIEWLYVGTEGLG